MARWRAVVFDLDDTLYPERDFVLSGFRAVAAWVEREFGIPANATYTQLSRLFEGGVRGDTFDRWLSGSPLSPSLAPRLVEVYRSHTPVIRPFPEVHALLAELRGRYRLGLLSDGVAAVQQLKVESLGLRASFDAIVLSDALAEGRTAWKPSPQPFLVLAAELGVAPTAAVYVADNPEKDFLGARRAGFGTIWCRRPGTEYSSLTPRSAEHAADDVLASLDRLAEVLDSGRAMNAGWVG